MRCQALSMLMIGVAEVVCYFLVTAPLEARFERMGFKLGNILSERVLYVLSNRSLYQSAGKSSSRFSSVLSWFDSQTKKLRSTIPSLLLVWS
jgi:hypothetical protein